jgi:hypothetical protein
MLKIINKKNVGIEVRIGSIRGEVCLKDDCGGEGGGDEVEEEEEEEEEAGELQKRNGLVAFP